MVDQANVSEQVQKAVEQNIREVHTSDNAQWRESRPDAKEKGNGQYSGDGGRKRKGKKTHEAVVVKTHRGFDMKI